MYQSLSQSAADFFSSVQPETHRIFHGRGQLFEGLEHLSVDWYSPVVLITTYEEIDDLEKLTDSIVQNDIHSQIESVMLQYRKRRGTPTQCLYKNPINQCIVSENGLKYLVQPGVNQNAGLFLDMRPLRYWLSQNSSEKNVLNLFAYTCSLSVAALSSGARQVVNVDMSKPSINWGARNHALNYQNPHSIKSVPHKLFRSWGRIKQFGRYDTIIIDPPTRQRGSFDVEKNYGAVLKKLKSLAAPNADVIATVNSPYLSDDFLINQFARHAPQCRFRTMMPRSDEFPDKFPERAIKIYHFSAN